MRLILSSDQHLRGDSPACRIETRQEWLSYQYERLCEIVAYANMKDADLVLGGDLFNTPRVDVEVITLFLDAIQPLLGTCYLIGGNHSLPNHREANIQQSSLGVLVAASALMENKIQYLVCKEELIDGRFQHSVQLTEHITVVHTCCFEKEEDVPFGAKATYVDELIKEFQTPWVLVGDLHQKYHREIQGHHVLSSGCMTAQSVREKDSELGVWYIDTGNPIDVSTQGDKLPVYRIQGAEVQWLPIKTDPDNVSTAHIQSKRDTGAMQALIEVLAKSDDICVDFLRNLLYYVETHPVSDEAEKILEEVRDGY